MKYRFIIKDDTNFTIEIVPSSYDLIVENVVKMMNLGMNVQQISFLDEEKFKVRDGSYLRGYKYEEGLYDKLIFKYEQLTADLGKREILRKW